VNRQIRVGDSKNVIVFDPLLNAAICSTFEVQYGKSTSARTTALRHLDHAQKLIRLLTQGRALFSQITLIIFIVEPPKL